MRHAASDLIFCSLLLFRDPYVSFFVGGCVWGLGGCVEGVSGVWDEEDRGGAFGTRLPAGRMTDDDLDLVLRAPQVARLLRAAFAVDDEHARDRSEPYPVVGLVLLHATTPGPRGFLSSSDVAPRVSSPLATAIPHHKKKTTTTTLDPPPQVLHQPSSPMAEEEEEEALLPRKRPRTTTLVSHAFPPMSPFMRGGGSLEEYCFCHLCKYEVLCAPHDLPPGKSGPILFQPWPEDE